MGPLLIVRTSYYARKCFSNNWMHLEFQHASKDFFSALSNRQKKYFNHFVWICCSATVWIVFTEYQRESATVAVVQSEYQHEHKILISNQVQSCLINVSQTSLLVSPYHSDSICQTQPKLLQILRRQCCLPTDPLLLVLGFVLLLLCRSCTLQSKGTMSQAEQPEAEISLK